MSYFSQPRRVLLLVSWAFCITLTLMNGLILTSQCPRAFAQTAPEHRWSLIEFPQGDQDPIWARIRRGEPLEPLEWERFAQQIAQDDQRRNLQDLALLAAGLGWFREGLYYRAADTFSRLTARDHPLTEIHLFFWAEALFHQGKYSESADQFNELARLRPGSLWVHRSRFREVDLLAALGDTKGIGDSRKDSRF